LAKEVANLGERGEGEWERGEVLVLVELGGDGGVGF